MKTICLCLIFCCASFLYATDLDSLVNQSDAGRQRAHSLKGFFVGKGVQQQAAIMQDTNKIMLSIDSSIAVPAPAEVRAIGLGTIGRGPGAGGGSGTGNGSAAGTAAVIRAGSGVMNYRITVLENEIKDLKSTEIKVTAILENLQKQSDSHTDNQNFITKILEIICGCFSTIFVAYLGLKLKKKTANENELSKN